MKYTYSTKRNWTGVLATRSIIIIAVVLVALVGLFAFRGLPWSADKATAPVTDSSGITYPAGWQLLKLTEDDKSAGILSKLNKQDSSAVLVLRRLSGALAKNFNIKTLPDELETSFKKSITGFKPVSKSLTKVGKYDAAKIQYEQTKEEDSELYENVMMVVPTPKQTFYLTFRAKKTDFSKIVSDSDAIISSFGSYVGRL